MDQNLAIYYFFYDINFDNFGNIAVIKLQYDLKKIKFNKK